MKNTNDSEEVVFCGSTLPSSVRPRILITGLLPGQQQKITEKFQNRASLSFIESGVRYLSGSQDYVIIYAKFSSHSTFNSLKNKAFGKRVKLLIHRGGLTTLAERIEELIARTNSEAGQVDSEV